MTPIRSLHPLAAAPALALTALLPAQAAVPDAHWGACIYPPSRVEARLSLAFNRFTEFSKTGDPNNPASPRFNEIDETMGLNIATIGWTDEFEFLDRRWTRTFDLGGGPTRDQPTKFLQNEYVHHMLGQDRVPVGKERDATEFVGGAGARAWFGDRELHGGEERDPHHAVLTEGYLGGGLAVSSLYHDTYLQLGGSMLFTDLIPEGPLHLWPRSHVELSASDRTSWLYASDAFAEVAHFANVAQAGIAVVPADFASTATGTLGEAFGRLLRFENLLPIYWPSLVYDVVGRPKIGAHVTYDTGLFVDAADSPIDTWFASFRFEWPTGLRVETYNDFANGTDWGPTFGVIVSWDLGTFSKSVLQ